jgi:hypothetical protein
VEVSGNCVWAVRRNWKWDGFDGVLYVCPSRKEARALVRMLKAQDKATYMDGWRPGPTA